MILKIENVVATVCVLVGLCLASTETVNFWDQLAICMIGLGMVGVGMWLLVRINKGEKND